MKTDIRVYLRDLSEEELAILKDFSGINLTQSVNDLVKMYIQHAKK